MGALVKGIGRMVGIGGGAEEDARDAADAQMKYGRDAMRMQKEQFDKTQANLDPFRKFGTDMLPDLRKALGLGDPNSPLNQQFHFNPKDLENTPGYQFTLKQGLKGLANENSATGGALSGAQLQGMSDYTTGLAQNTYGQEYNRALQGFMTNYGQANDRVSRLMNMAGMGMNAASGLGSLGAQNANSLSGLMEGIGNAKAGGIMGYGKGLDQRVQNIVGMIAGLSDATQKTAIEKIGKTPGGHNLYKFKYKKGGDNQIGVMAQEVEKTVPEAVIEVDGIKYVDYSKVK